MSFAYSVMVSDFDVGGRRVGGLSASIYLLTVSRWIPNSLAIPPMDCPLRFASCTAFHLSLWRKVGFRGEAETVIASTSFSSVAGSYSFASSSFAFSSPGTEAGASAKPLGSGGGRVNGQRALGRSLALPDLAALLGR